jgi:hypothetical protein
MILTTTCNAKEFEAIKAAALGCGLQITAAPGFIYKKGNWIVGGTQETEDYFNQRVPSKSVTPDQFQCSLQKEAGPDRSMFIVCETEKDRDTVISYFTGMIKAYKEPDRHIPDGLAVCVIPSEKTVMVTFKYVARQNAKEGYTMIDFETFKTIAG